MNPILIDNPTTFKLKRAGHNVPALYIFISDESNKFDFYINIATIQALELSNEVCAQDGLYVMILETNKILIMGHPFNCTTTYYEIPFRRKDFISLLMKFQEEGKEEVCILEAFAKSKVDMTPCIKVNVSDDAMEIIKSNPSASIAFDRLQGLARRHSKGLDDPIDLHVTKDGKQDCYFTLFRDKNMLINGGINRHDDGSYSINT